MKNKVYRVRRIAPGTWQARRHGVYWTGAGKTADLAIKDLEAQHRRSRSK